MAFMIAVSTLALNALAGRSGRRRGVSGHPGLRPDRPCLMRIDAGHLEHVDGVRPRRARPRIHGTLPDRFRVASRPAAASGLGAVGTR